MGLDLNKQAGICHHVPKIYQLFLLNGSRKKDVIHKKEENLTNTDTAF